MLQDLTKMSLKMPNAAFVLLKPFLNCGTALLSAVLLLALPVAMKSPFQKNKPPFFLSLYAQADC